MSVQTTTISYQSDVTFEGYLAWNDEIKTPVPGVLISHAYGGLGEFEKNKAKLKPNKSINEEAIYLVIKQPFSIWGRTRTARETKYPLYPR